MKWPTTDQMRAFSGFLENNCVYGQYVKKLFGLMDGGMILYANYTDFDLQNSYV